MKRCARCKNILTPDHFSRDKSMKDGLEKYCKICNRKRMREIHRKAKYKYLARNTINNGIRDGKIIRMPCEICGEEKSEAHHNDYSQPLNVRWLCKKHHTEEHKTWHKI